jgi:hypothetical protein
MTDTVLAAPGPATEPSPEPFGEARLWQGLRAEAARAASREEMLRGFIDLAVLRHAGFAVALSALLASRIWRGWRWPTIRRSSPPPSPISPRSPRAIPRPTAM